MHRGTCCCSMPDIAMECSFAGSGVLVECCPESAGLLFRWQSPAAMPGNSQEATLQWRAPASQLRAASMKYNLKAQAEEVKAAPLLFYALEALTKILFNTQGCVCSTELIVTNSIPGTRITVLNNSCTVSVRANTPVHGKVNTESCVLTCHDQ